MIDIIITGQDATEERLAAIAEGLSTPPVQAGLEILSKSLLETFVVGGRPGWVDILQSSRDARVEDHGTPPLWDTGAMADAATATRPGVEGSLYALGEGEAWGQIGVDPLFHGARRHSFGFGVDVLGRHFNEPARPFMAIRPEDRVAVTEMFEAWMGALIEVIK